MKKNNTIFVFLILCILILLCMTGCKNEMNNEDLKSKIVQELDYLDTRIVSILNKLNNISMQNYTITSEEITLQQESSGESGSSGEGKSSNEGSSNNGGTSSGGGSGSEQGQSSSQTEKNNITTTKMQPGAVLESDENDIDWLAIKNDIETINEAWGVVILDLSTLNVDNNDVLDFSSTLDDCIVSIKDENKIDTLTNMATLYSFIPKFERALSTSNSNQNIKQAKSYIINAYSLVEQNDWGGIETNISECEQTYKNLINDIEYIQDKEYKVNKTYVLIKELQNSLSYKDRKLFYVKYKNLMESINVL